jgi:proline dehydrogenase
MRVFTCQNTNMLRSLFIGLSQSATFRKIVLGFPLTRRVSRRFVAGERIEEAVAAIQRLNQRGLLATFDHLGENVTTADEAIEAGDTYIGMLDTIDANRLQSNVSLKLTHLGLDIDPAVCRQNVRRIVERAKALNNFVRIDMEGSAYTQTTLDVVDELRASGLTNVGVVIQAYLYRSADDVRRLAESGVNIRICKGAYNEPANIAYPNKADVDQNYRNLVSIMWDKSPLYHGAIAALATHDENVIAWAKDEAARRGIQKDQFEFQMLYGIRRERQEQLAREGYRFRVYVPFGMQWYPYFMRRLAERPANVIFLARNLFDH